jgi:hypothetical protein
LLLVVVAIPVVVVVVVAAAKVADLATVGGICTITPLLRVLSTFLK